MATETHTGRIEIPGFTNIMIGDYIFPRDPTAISYSFPDRNAVYAILGSDIAEIQEMGSGILAIGLNVTLTSDDEVDDFLAAIRKRGERRFYINSSRFYKVYGGDVSFPREGTSPVARRMTAALICKEPFKYSHSAITQTDTIIASGQQVFIDNNGSAYLEPTFQLTANENIDSPVISDGTRSITYATTLVATDVLIINSNLTCTKNGTDDSGNLTVSNGFPRLEAGETTELDISFTSGADSTLVTSFRQRWW